jgi:hypothetical protein
MRSQAVLGYLDVFISYLFISTDSFLPFVLQYIQFLLKYVRTLIKFKNTLHSFGHLHLLSQH